MHVRQVSARSRMECRVVRTVLIPSSPMVSGEPGFIWLTASTQIEDVSGMNGGRGRWVRTEKIPYNLQIPIIQEIIEHPNHNAPQRILRVLARHRPRKHIIIRRRRTRCGWVGRRRRRSVLIIPSFRRRRGQRIIRNRDFLERVRGVRIMGEFAIIHLVSMYCGRELVLKI